MPPFAIAWDRLDEIEHRDEREAVAELLARKPLSRTQRGLVLWPKILRRSECGGMGVVYQRPRCHRTMAMLQAKAKPGQLTLPLDRDFSNALTHNDRNPRWGELQMHRDF